jgi:hypothetical protein
VEFISVLEVVESIATKVAWPAELPDRYFELPEASSVAVADALGKLHFPAVKYRVKMDFLNSLFMRAYRVSTAAGALDYVLDRNLDQAKEEIPRWYDWGPTGWPKVSQSARAVGLSMLVHMSRYFYRYEVAYQSGRFNDWPDSDVTTTSEGKFATKADAERISEIGFDRAEIIRFLNHHGIHNGLGTELSELSDEPPDCISTASHYQVGTETKINLDSSFGNKIDSHTGSGSISHRINRRGHILADLIAAAQIQAGEQRDDYRIVYSNLVTMAENGDFSSRIRPLQPRNGIEYLSGADYKFYSPDALRKYLNPKARGPKK